MPLKHERQIKPAEGPFSGRKQSGSSQSREAMRRGIAPPSPALLARALYEERRRRDQFFRASLFAEPAWDILLDLRIQARAARMPSVSSACIGSAAPPSTALRYLLVLESEGLVERSVDPTDARRKLTRLSHRGAELLDAYLHSIGSDRANERP